jgi:hypothetical protein
MQDQPAAPSIRPTGSYAPMTPRVGGGATLTILGIVAELRNDQAQLATIGALAAWIGERVFGRGSERPWSSTIWARSSSWPGSTSPFWSWS